MNQTLTMHNCCKKLTEGGSPFGECAQITHFAAECFFFQSPFKENEIRINCKATNFVYLRKSIPLAGSLHRAGYFLCSVL